MLIASLLIKWSKAYYPFTNYIRKADICTCNPSKIAQVTIKQLLITKLIHVQSNSFIYIIFLLPWGLFFYYLYYTWHSNNHLTCLPSQVFKNAKSWLCQKNVNLFEKLLFIRNRKINSFRHFEKSEI